MSATNNAPFFEQPAHNKQSFSVLGDAIVLRVQHSPFYFIPLDRFQFTHHLFKRFTTIDREQTLDILQDENHRSFVPDHLHALPKNGSAGVSHSVPLPRNRERLTGKATHVQINIWNVLDIAFRHIIEDYLWLKVGPYGRDAVPVDL